MAKSSHRPTAHMAPPACPDIHQRSVGIVTNSVPPPVSLRDNWPQPTEEAILTAPLHMKLYYDVRNSGVPNYPSVRRQVPSDLVCDTWDEYLAGYHDEKITKFLRYGWPVEYVSPQPPVSTSHNHASATRNPASIKKFLDKELLKGALLGPFSQPPFEDWTQISPLMTRDKPDGTGKRVIIDLSFPKGHGVNDGILKTDTPSYQLPTPLDLADLILQSGQGCFLWKSDLSRAYRQLRIDPLDYPLLGIKFENEYYIDICLSFGC